MAVLTVGFAVVHPTFLFVADWLGPTLGSSLLNVLTIVYLILRGPLRFTVLLALWGGAAFLAGVIIRRRVGSIVTILLILVALLAMLGINLIDVGFTASQIFEIFEGSNLLEAPPSRKGSPSSTYTRPPSSGTRQRKPSGRSREAAPRIRSASSTGSSPASS